MVTFYYFSLCPYERKHYLYSISIIIFFFENSNLMENVNPLLELETNSQTHKIVLGSFIFNDHYCTYFSGKLIKPLNNKLQPIVIL